MTALISRAPLAHQLLNLKFALKELLLPRNILADEIMNLHAPTTSLKQGKFEGIQALRFIAALLVVGTHATFYTHERLDPEYRVWSFGAIGVDIFFVISGFVMMITADAFQGSDGWKKFVARRILRIVPMYWLATTLKLVTMVALPAAVLHAELDPVKVILSYFFLPSTNVDGRFEPLLGVGWTLIFEMFFYALFAIGLALRLRLMPFIGVILGLCCIASLFRQPTWPAGTIYFSPIVIFFFIGMLIAGATLRYGPGRLLAPAIAGLLVILTAVLVYDIEIAAKAKSIGGIVFASCVVMLIVSIEPWIGARLPKWLLFMGEASYVLYLFHPLTAPAVPALMARIGLELPDVSVAACIAVALGASIIIHQFIEKPVTNGLRPLIPYASATKRHLPQT